MKNSRYITVLAFAGSLLLGGCVAMDDIKPQSGTLLKGQLDETTEAVPSRADAQYVGMYTKLGDPLSFGRFTSDRPDDFSFIKADSTTYTCDGKVAVPGFVNMHTHSPMSLMRGIGEDMVFQDWLDRIWKVEDRLDKEYVYWATKVACLEMIRTGTTTFNDQYWFFDTSVKAAREMGM